MASNETEITTSTTIKLSSNTWKENAAASVDDIVPSIAYVSLYDLIQGKKLMHSAFIYDKDLYSITTYEATKTNTKEFSTYGIDIGIPIYDDRSLTEKVEIPEALLPAFRALTTDEKHYLYIPRKTDAIRPATVAEFVSSSILTRNGSTKTETSYSAQWLKKYCSNFRSNQDTENIYKYNSVPLGLISLDVPTSLDPVLCILSSSENSSLEKLYYVQVYDRLKLNLLSTNTLQSAAALEDQVKEKSIEITSSKNRYFIDIFLRFVFSHFDHIPGETLGNLYDATNEVSLATKIAENIDDPDVVALLKKLYVWVKAPFLADYVDAESFGQELNKQSNVVHKNVLITGTGDFTRLDNASDKYDNSTKPKHLFFETPIKDFISDEYYTNSNLAGTDTSIQSLLSVLSINSFNEDNDIGEPLLEARSHKTNYAKDNNSILDIGYYNPDLVDTYTSLFASYHSTLAEEIQKDYDQTTSTEKYRFNSVAKPRIVPESGNLWVDGRIFSPSINELWYIIKKLISGRGIDAQAVDTSLQNVNQDSGTIDNINRINQHFNRTRNGIDGIPTTRKSYLQSKVDTRLLDVETSNYAFRFSDTSDDNSPFIYGDPIDIQYKTLDHDNDGYLYDEDIETAIVKAYVTQPDRNDLYVLPYLADRLKKRKDYSLNASTIYSVLPKDLIQIGLTQGRYDYPVVDLTTYDSETDTPGTGHKEGYSDSGFATLVETYPGSRWSPREAPLSLRELESNILNNRMNIESIVEWIDNDTVANGAYQYVNPLGSPYDDERKTDTETEVQSMLFMLHRDYNHQFVNPNTNFNLYHVDTETDTDKRGKTYYKQTTTELKTYNKDTDDYTKIDVVENFGTNITLKRFAEEDELVDVHGKKREAYQRLPVFARNYGTEVKESQYEFNTNDVVMTADGTWQYLHAYTRLPILRSVF